MARYTGAKTRLMRKVGEDIGLKSNAVKVTKRLAVRPGQHGARGRRKLSDYGVQLKEKQKLKYIYGVLERQLHRLYVEAGKNPTATGSALLSLLERRLDNVVYRMGWAPTRAAARQLVAHGNVRVNERKMSIASYQVQLDDVISLKPKATHIPVVAELLKDDNRAIPTWLKRKASVGTVTRLPERADVTEIIDEQLIIEYYSR